MNDFSRRARQVLIGLAIGDAISWPAMFHRSRLLPAWTRRLRREIDAQREATSVTRVPMPFSLNQPPGSFDLFPTDDTEWAAWTMMNLHSHDCHVNRDWVNAVWSELARSQSTVRGAISTMAAIENFRRGLTPPATGSDNPHYFDDGAMPRAVPIGIAYAGRPAQAAEAAALDARITNAEDGVFVASAVASAISVACAGGSPPSVIDAAVSALPEHCWSRQAVCDALEVARTHASLLSLIPSLHTILNVEYSDGCAGPETLALSLAIVSKCGSGFERAVTGATVFAKGADGVPAIVGAIAGALAEEFPKSEDWPHLALLHGVCLSDLYGVDYIQLIEEFVGACESSMKTQNMNE
jgi:ADP-ribosylglycohydrolase